jgi:ketosteroid isomerase-like protein
MSAEDVELAREAVRAFNKRDVEWLIDHATEEQEWYPAITTGVEGKPFRGHAGVRQFFSELDEVWEEFSLAPEEIRDLGDAILILGQVRARARNGVEFEQSLDGVWEVRDHKIVSGRSYLDREEALRVAAEVSEERGRE